MYEKTAKPSSNIETPWWQRLTAFLFLGSITILTGIAIAAILSITILGVLFGLQGSD